MYDVRADIPNWLGIAARHGWYRCIRRRLRRVDLSVTTAVVASARSGRLRHRYRSGLPRILLRRWRRGVALDRPGHPSRRCADFFRRRSGWRGGGGGSVQAARGGGWVVNGGGLVCSGGGGGGRGGGGGGEVSGIARVLVGVDGEVEVQGKEELDL
jgi:hypothetical protein